MDAELKTKWVEALRSGKYKQAKGSLYDGDGYCCLGVLCRVVGLKIDSNGDGVEGTGTYSPIYKILGRPDEQGAVHDLTVRNDGGMYRSELFQQRDFKQLADYIEKHL